MIRRIRSLWIVSTALALAIAITSFGRADDVRQLPDLGPESAVWLDSEGSAAFGAWLQEAIQAQPDPPEWLAMLADILKGSRLGPESGWFPLAPAQTRYDWEATQARYDADGDGKVSRGEFPGSETDFARLDRNHSGSIDSADFDWSEHALAASPGSMLYRMADTNGDGRVVREELLALFERADSNSQGFLALDDLRALLPMPMSTAPSGGGGGSGATQQQPERRAGPSKATLVRALFAQELGALAPGPKVGDPAPDFRLKTVEGDREVSLSEQLGAKPTVLVFGTFTCGPFRTQGGNIQKLYERYKDRANFLMIYVREAHPTDGWYTPDPVFDPRVAQPTTDDQRRSVAQSCQKTLGFDMPFLVDTIDDAVGGTYSGMPNRLYLIDVGGTVAYKSGRGPFGFKPAQLEQALLLHLATAVSKSRTDGVGDAPGGDDQAWVPLLDHEEAWARLPVEHGEGPAPVLPTWARALARALPGTTARMLDLDYIQRSRSPLAPDLRAAMRWAAADANKSPYGRAYAEADLRRTGLDEVSIRRLTTGPWADLPEPVRNALAFARQLTLRADQVTDAEVAALIAEYGEAPFVAMVHMLAYANFQDRVLLSLGIEIEPEGPLPPLAVRLDPSAMPDVPVRVLPGDPTPPVPTHVDDPLWAATDYDALQALLDGQRGRESRIRVPTFEEMLAGLPEDYPRPTQPQRVKWTLVGMGFQPELTGAWLNTMRTFSPESQTDGIFRESIFWVVTRTIQCFY